MSESTASTWVTVSNPQGMHLRPAGSFAQTAAQFSSRIEVKKDNQPADGKSVMDLLTLAVSGGEKMFISAEGPDAEAAIEALAQLVENGFETNRQSETTEITDEGS